MKSAGKARNNGLYRHIRTSKEIIRNLLNDYIIKLKFSRKNKIEFKNIRKILIVILKSCKQNQNQTGSEGAG